MTTHRIGGAVLLIPDDLELINITRIDDPLPSFTVESKERGSDNDDPVREIVRDEILAQKRPGGLLSA